MLPVLAAYQDHRHGSPTIAAAVLGPARHDQVAEAMSDHGSRMGAARLGQAASGAVIVAVRRPLAWAEGIAKPI